MFICRLFQAVEEKSSSNMSKITNSISEASRLIREGRVGIFPTDTAFGIGCRIDDENAVARVYRIRRRPSEKAVLALVGSLAMAENYVQLTKEAHNIIARYWPGGLTVILKCRPSKVPLNVRANGDTLAVRMPNHTDILRLINEVGVPIIAPSANFSGEKTPLTFEEVSKQLINEVDFVLTGMCTIKGVSTIIDATHEPVTVVRKGVVEYK